MQYIIQQGDTLTQIALRFNVPIGNLLKSNPQIKDPGKIYTGQVIEIPPKGQSAPNVSGTRQYIVKTGDNFGRISERSNVSYNKLLNANPQVKNPDLLFPGQVIYIPIGPGSIRPPEYTEYVVQDGDTFAGIARKLDIPLQSLIDANLDIRNINFIQPGQIIQIPKNYEEIVQTNRPYGYNTMVADIDALLIKFPFIEKKVIGKSVMGRDIIALRLGKGPKMVQYNAAHHANEWITTPVVMKFIEEYARSYETGKPLGGFDIRKLFNDVTLWVIPMVNPDGVDIVVNGVTPQHPYYKELLRINGGNTNFNNWRANIRGVDINRNYPIDWEKAREVGPKSPSPGYYAGPAPASEPETQAIIKFSNENKFDRALAFHTQGKVIFWGYKDIAEKESRYLVNRFSEVSGYRPIPYEEGAYYGGFKEWYMDKFRRPAFAPELGTGTNPLPISQFPEIWNDVIGLMLLGTAL